MKTEDLIAEVAALPVDERAMIAEAILRSLNPPDSAIDQQWATVAKRRLAEIESGAVKAIPGEEVFERIWKRFAK